MSNPFAFWKWEWDERHVFTDQARFEIWRRHLGPVTIYRYTVVAIPDLPLTWWMICPWDDVSFGAHLPKWVERILVRAFTIGEST